MVIGRMKRMTPGKKQSQRFVYSKSGESCERLLYPPYKGCKKAATGWAKKKGKIYSLI